MATFMEYTPEQRSEIDYLINRGKRVHKRINQPDQTEDKMALQRELDIIRGDLQDVLNARLDFNDHIEAATRHIEEAEELKRKWGF